MKLNPISLEKISENLNGSDMTKKTIVPVPVKVAPTIQVQPKPTELKASLQQSQNSAPQGQQSPKKPCSPRKQAPFTQAAAAQLHQLHQQE